MKKEYEAPFCKVVTVEKKDILKVTPIICKSSLSIDISISKASVILSKIILQ